MDKKNTPLSKKEIEELGTSLMGLLSNCKLKKRTGCLADSCPECLYHFIYYYQTLSCGRNTPEE